MYRYIPRGLSQGLLITKDATGPNQLSQGWQRSAPWFLFSSILSLFDLVDRLKPELMIDINCSCSLILPFNLLSFIVDDSFHMCGILYYVSLYKL